jgi:methionine synthase II (cobalamin-independent)
VHEVNTIQASVPVYESVAQVEATAEMLMVAKAYERSPNILGPIMARIMGRQIAKLINSFPPDVDVDLHYCLGSLNNRADGRMAKDLTPFVALANATTKRLDRDPLHVHCPVAPTDTPAIANEEYYRPLHANNRQSVDEQRGILSTIRNFMPGRVVGLSTSCGMGRYERDEGEQLLRTVAAVARE